MASPPTVTAASRPNLFRGGHNLSQALVAAGAAFVYWQYISGCDRNTYSR